MPSSIYSMEDFIPLIPVLVRSECFKSVSNTQMNARLNPEGGWSHGTSMWNLNVTTPCPDWRPTV